MGIQAGIDISFQENYSPSFMLNNILANNWSINYYNYVSFLLPDDIDEYNWQSVPIQDFDLARFLLEHNKKVKIGIELVSDEIGGAFIIYPEYLSISLSINRIYINEQKRIIDYSWYLNRLAPFLQKVNVSSIECSLIY